MNINWEAISAIGTILAALVGISGIWIVIYENRRKLTISFEKFPRLAIYISNNSARPVAVIKTIYFVKDHVFYCDSHVGLNEIILGPAVAKRIELDPKSLLREYNNLNLSDITNSADTIIITVYDNYGRKYKIKCCTTMLLKNFQRMRN